MGRVIGILVIVLILAVVLLLLTAISVLAVWAASGVGWVMVHWLRLPFTPFEATLLSLIAFVVVTWSAAQLLGRFLTLPLQSHPEDEDDEEDEDWEDEDDEDYEEKSEPQRQYVSSVPKWRQPIRNARNGLPVVDPDDRCPCGSGRKYKNCHGRKK
jgi:hypothetical protein